jgi:hypothetical protein
MILTIAALASMSAACNSGTSFGGAGSTSLDWGPASNSLFKPPADGSSVVGDWYPCADKDCTATLAQGIRFTDDGRIQLIERGQDPSNPNGVCILAGDNQGTYVFEGGSLTVTSPDGKQVLVLKFDLQGDGTGLLEIPSGTINQPNGNQIPEQALLKRFDSDPNTSECPMNVPVGVNNGGTGTSTAPTPAH